MRTKEKIPSMIEIVFENRNKSYGAFELRSNYNKRLAISFSLTLSVFLLLILFAIIKNKKGIDTLNVPMTDVIDISKNFTV